jgi:DNA invertase Pin-like site-specific DNA recombinase
MHIRRSMGMIVGYGRVSTIQQNLARQEEIFARYGVEKPYFDKKSGKDMERGQLKEMVAYIREGDTLIIESLSRLGRNTLESIELFYEIEKKGVKIVSDKEHIDTSTATGRFLLGVFASLAQMERETMLERQREGIELAKAAGKYLGRPMKKIEGEAEVMEAYRADLIGATAAAKLLGLSRSSFYRHAERFNKNTADSA